MSSILRYLGQGVVYALIAALFGVFATWPAFRHFEADQAQLTLSVAHSAKHVSECRRLTAAEIAALPANMRKPMECPRGRLPVLVEVELDGQAIVGASIPPSGLFGDGPSQIYKNFTIPSGRHTLAVRLRDSARSEGFDYTHEATVEIRPRQRLVIEFRAEAGGFRLSGAAGHGAEPTRIAGGTAMSLVEWREEFRTGIADVDHEHEFLIRLLNDLHARLGAGADAAQVEAFLGQVHAKISAHFALEERIMRDRRYDQYADHKDDHESLLEGIRDIMDDYRDGLYLDYSEVLAEHLQTWFTEHFKTRDARLHKMLG